MSHIISNILIGFQNFPLYAILFTIPIFVVPVLLHKKINAVRIVLDYLCLLYILCLIALVFFPLPDAAQAAAMSGHRIQLVPFQFVFDIIRESPFMWNHPLTYLPALLDDAVLQVVFNVLMMLPFGMFLKYSMKCSIEQVIGFTFLFSLTIELAQFTGLFFLYHGSYRLCDVDDLMLNTFGGYLGYQLIFHLQHVIPQIHHFDREILSPRELRERLMAKRVSRHEV